MVKIISGIIVILILSTGVFAGEVKPDKEKDLSHEESSAKKGEQSPEVLKKKQIQLASDTADQNLSKKESLDASKKNIDDKKESKGGDSKHQTLSEQIKDALTGNNSGTLNLRKKNKKDVGLPLKEVTKESSTEKIDSSVLKKDVNTKEIAHPSPHVLSFPKKNPSVNVKKIKMLSEANAHGWSYEGDTGPEHWAELDPAFSSCKEGSRQSPILIESDKTMAGPGTELIFEYSKNFGKVINNGHTFEVNVEEGSQIIARGEVYKLIQFHFHHPSEEKIDYKGFPMVAHLVHKSDSGALAVVAVEFEIGEENPAVEAVWRSIPLDVGDKAMISGGVNVSDLLPPLNKRKYYQFLGSLTTPPCSEGVLWTVLKSPMTISRKQLETFSHFFPMNARPIQNLNGRLVRELE